MNASASSRYAASRFESLALATLVVALCSARRLFLAILTIHANHKPSLVLPLLSKVRNADSSAHRPPPTCNTDPFHVTQHYSMSHTPLYATHPITYLTPHYMSQGWNSAQDPSVPTWNTHPFHVTLTPHHILSHSPFLSPLSITQPPFASHLSPRTRPHSFSRLFFFLTLLLPLLLLLPHPCSRLFSFSLSAARGLYQLIPLTIRLRREGRRELAHAVHARCALGEPPRPARRGARPPPQELARGVAAEQ